ncbi:peptidylprolyl isomerase [Pseudodesulfovibrio sp. zrk46]|uniref:peptidylprolyl isomerase n=1 Tax=Pseudodesulfovibrio sp. zrk46 TaxID=2725288 RepID=UPI001448B969|nr:peptidylprolyl isomerase [Pseudodesulfovibrio sp. zrk46]QJB55860.1 peptidylprolyl isomerase [Pseudodesulfovibrio sp. zrk46]
MHTLRYTILTLALLVFTMAGGLTSSADAAGPNPVVVMETSMGRIIMMLYPKAAPKTVENFLKYVDAGFYDKTIFHRSITMEMMKVAEPRLQPSYNIVQGGGFTAGPRPKRPLFPPIKDESEFSLKNEVGTIAMARTSDPDSATSQFFFNMTDNTGLDYVAYKRTIIVGYKDEDQDDMVRRPGYTAFGKVIRGWDTVEKIHQIETQTKGRYKNTPVKDVYIVKAYRAK